MMAFVPNKSPIPPELAAEIEAILCGKPDAVRFVVFYGHYIEAIDDLVDEPKDIRRIEYVTSMAADLFSSNYWLKNCDSLRLVEKLIHREYFDCVAWEFSGDEWKRRDAKCMSHCGYNMLFAIILLEAGSAALEKISLKFREQAHLKHLHDQRNVA